MRDEDYATAHMMSTYGGSFVQALACAAFVADAESLDRLKAAWPEYWKEYASMAERARRDA